MIGVGTFKVTDKHREYVNNVLNSERLSYGPYIQKFERLFAAAHGCRFAIMTNSGTSSLHIALAALKARHGWADGDEVIVPAVTFVATSNVVIQNNMKPVFVDIEPDYYELDPSKIEAAITDKTRCIMPVHLFGSPCDMDPILEIADKHNLRIIEDSCETMFSNYKGRSVGSFGDVGCFSTYVAHILTTGVGGLCTTNDPELAVTLRSLMNHGRDSIYISIDDDKNKSDDEMKMIVQRRFRFVQPGYSYRVTEFEGALGLAEFEIRDEMMRKRRENGQYFMQKLAGLSEHLRLPKIRPESDHAFMMFPIVLRNEPKDRLVQYLEKRGVETRDMLPLTNQPFYQKDFGVNENDFPEAKIVNNNGFYIASHQGLTAAQKEYIVQVFHDYYTDSEIIDDRAALIFLSKFDQKPDELKIEKFLENIPKGLFQELILADSSAGKDIHSVFENKGFKIIHQPKSPKGTIIEEALTGLTSRHIVLCGTDGADNISDAEEMLLHLRTGKQLVIASRFMVGGNRSDDRLFSVRSLGNRFFSFLLSVVYNKNISDTNNLFRAFDLKWFKSLTINEKGEGFVFEMSAQALKTETKIDEVPTVEHRIEIPRKRRNRLGSAFHFLFILMKNL